MYESLTPMEYLISSPVSTISAGCGEGAFQRFDRNLRHRAVSRPTHFELSKGTRQKLLIASALIHRPEVLFLESR